MLDLYGIGSIVGAVGIGQLLILPIQAIIDRRRNKASAIATETGSVLEWAKSMREDIIMLKTELDKVRKEATDCQLKWSQLKTDFDILKLKYELGAGKTGV